MTEHTPTENARQVLVSTVDGVRVPGWIVRSDVVVVQAGGLKAPLTVTIDGEPLVAEAAYETTLRPDDEQPWTALELPLGTVEVIGELRPPTLPGEDSGDTLIHSERIAFWCLVFPRMRGCR